MIDRVREAVSNLPVRVPFYNIRNTGLANAPTQDVVHMLERDGMATVAREGQQGSGVSVLAKRSEVYWRVS